MTNKLVVIINSLKVPTLKKMLLYEMKFLVPNYSCLQNPWLGATAPISRFSLSSVLNWICWTPPPPEQNSWVRHCNVDRTRTYVTVQTDRRFCHCCPELLVLYLCGIIIWTLHWFTELRNESIVFDTLITSEIITAECNNILWQRHTVYP
jgi:hypothetical protein